MPGTCVAHVTETQQFVLQLFVDRTGDDFVEFGRSLGGKSPSWRSSALLGGISVAWTCAIFGTSWFFEPEVSRRIDWFGNEHIAVHARWPANLLGLYIGGSVIWGLRRLPASPPTDRSSAVTASSCRPVP